MNDIRAKEIKARNLSIIKSHHERATASVCPAHIEL